MELIQVIYDAPLRTTWFLLLIALIASQFKPIIIAKEHHEHQDKK